MPPGGTTFDHCLTLRRCQILLASAASQAPALIARNLGCTARSARNAVHAFDTEGLACLKEKSSRPHSARPLLDAAFDEPLRHLLHQSPRTQGQLRSTWTLALVAQVCHAKGWTPRVLSLDTIRLAIQRLGVSWKRAKHWITSPDPAYAHEKKRDRLIRLAATHPDWVLGFQDECWWSRLAQPNLHAGAGDEPLRLCRSWRSASRTRTPRRHGLLRAVAGRHRRDAAAFCGRPAGEPGDDGLFGLGLWGSWRGKASRRLLLVWDNASWHISQRVRAWLKEHNRRTKREGGVRLLVCRLPSKSPWLNSIEPKWVHGKRAIVEPEQVLTAREVETRACDYYGCTQHEHLQQTDPPKKLAAKRKKVA